MSDHVAHCPFLNRADSRCSNHFSLDRLDNAFEECFGDYQCCPTYAELLIERRVRRAEESMLVRGERHDGQTPFVQLRLQRDPNSYAKAIA